MITFNPSKMNILIEHTNQTANLYSNFNETSPQLKLTALGTTQIIVSHYDDIQQSKHMLNYYHPTCPKMPGTWENKASQVEQSIDSNLLHQELYLAIFWYLQFIFCCKIRLIKYYPMDSLSTDCGVMIKSYKKS